MPWATGLLFLTSSESVAEKICYHKSITEIWNGLRGSGLQAPISNYGSVVKTLWVKWYCFGSLKSVLLGIFTPQKLASGLNHHPKDMFIIEDEGWQQVKCMPHRLP